MTEDFTGIFETNTETIFIPEYMGKYQQTPLVGFLFGFGMIYFGSFSDADPGFLFFGLLIFFATVVLILKRIRKISFTHDQIFVTYLLGNVRKFSYSDVDIGLSCITLKKVRIGTFLFENGDELISLMLKKLNEQNKLDILKGELSAKQFRSSRIGLPACIIGIPCAFLYMKYIGYYITFLGPLISFCIVSVIFVLSAAGIISLIDRPKKKSIIDTDPTPKPVIDNKNKLKRIRRRRKKRKNKKS